MTKVMPEKVKGLFLCCMKSIILLFALFLSLQPIKAQQSTLGPHGGRLKTAGNYKIELFGCDNYLEIYLFDRDSNTINNTGITGTIEFYYTGEATLSSTLVHYGMDGFTAKIPNNTFLYSKPSFNINGQFVLTEKFENECLNRN